MNPFYEENFIPVNDSFKNWTELCSKPYDKGTAHPYTKTRVILMNGTEFEQNWFLHQFSRHCNNNELRREVANIRRHEQQQQKIIASLKPIDETDLETTIAYEQLAIDLTAILARHTEDENVRNALHFALLEDFDHLYRFANLLEMEQGIQARDLTKDYTEIMPGRPTISEHRHPFDGVNHFICNCMSDPFTKLATNIITGAEQQTMNYYMNIANFHNSELGRKLYTEIAMIEEQHVTEYGSLLDTNATWLECWVMHEYTECYLYYSCYEDETDKYIKDIYYKMYLEECGHLQKASEMLKKYEGKDWQSLFPCGGDFPELLKFEGNIDYIRDVLSSTVYLTKDREGYVDSRGLSSKDNFKKYNKQVNGGKSNDPAHEVIEKHIKSFGEDYRYEVDVYPIEELSDRAKDNTSVGR
ncbi:MAG: hypothetical protein E7354_05495 [Clostridiales bacterium]|nr:hypothetical protein [Clostridiales bacterium]